MHVGLQRIENIHEKIYQFGFIDNTAAPGYINVYNISGDNQRVLSGFYYFGNYRDYRGLLQFKTKASILIRLTGIKMLYNKIDNNCGDAEK